MTAGPGSDKRPGESTLLQIFHEVVRTVVKVARSVARSAVTTQEAIGVAAFTVMAVVLVAQVAARNLLPFSFFWAEEVARLALIVMTMCGLGYGVGRGSHLAVTAISNVLPEQARTWMDRVVLLLVAGVAIPLSFSAMELVESIGGVQTSSSGIPRSVYFIAGAVGFGLAALQAVLALIAGTVDEPEGIVEEHPGV